MAPSVATDPHPDPRARIIEAAARLLSDGGSATVTTRAVARAAGTAAPAIFRIFGDKDALMDAVAEHVMATYVAATCEQARLEAGDPVRALREAWGAHLDFGLANPDLFVLLTAPGRGERSPAVTAGVGVLEARVRRVAAAGLLGVSEARAVAMIHAAGTGAVLTLLQQPPGRRDHALADSILEAVLGAVLAAIPAPPASDLAPLAVALHAAVPELPALSEAERGLLREWLSRSVAAMLEQPAPGPGAPATGVSR